MKYAIATVLCAVAAVAGFVMRGRSEREPAEPWEQRYNALRSMDATLPELVRQPLPGGMSIAVPAGTTLFAGATERAGEFALGRVQDLVKPVGRIVLVWWRPGALAAERLPLPDDPVARITAFTKDMGDLAFRSEPAQPSLRDALVIALRSRNKHVYAHYHACGDRVVGVLAWDDRTPSFGDYIDASFRCR